MTFKVNIEHGVCGADSTSLYTTDELISYGLSGCLYAGETDLTAFVEQIVSHYETKCVAHDTDINDLEDDAYSRGRSELLDEIKNYLENI
jgi:hypothetical protein